MKSCLYRHAFIELSDEYRLYHLNEELHSKKTGGSCIYGVKNKAEGHLYSQYWMGPSNRVDDRKCSSNIPDLLGTLTMNSKKISRVIRSS